MLNGDAQTNKPITPTTPKPTNKPIKNPSPTKKPISNPSINFAECNFGNDNEINDIRTVHQIPLCLPQGKLVRKYFSKYMRVFGLHIFGNRLVTDDSMRHTASILASYLDNNYDGVIDDLSVVKNMRKESATMAVFNKGCGGKMNKNIHKNYKLQCLYQTEIKPNVFGGDDATIEEVLHIITQFGYANAYPDKFAETTSSQIANIMDTARGKIIIIN